MNTITEIYKILGQHKDIALATIGTDEKPKIRVFQIMKIDAKNNVLYFATSPMKEIYSQLQKNPSVELLCMVHNQSIRIEGQVLFDVTDEVGNKIFNANPVLPRLYKSYKDLVYFCLPISSIHYYNLNTNPPTNMLFRGDSLN